MKELPKDIPPMEYEFSIITLEGKTTKTRYTGKFKYTIPNMHQKALIGRYKAELNGGLDPFLEEDIKVLHFMISYLRFTLISYPDWWEKSNHGYDLHDFNIVDEIYNKVEQFREDWMEKVWGKSDEKEN
jgi:hypothetical protein